MGMMKKLYQEQIESQEDVSIGFSFPDYSPDQLEVLNQMSKESEKEFEQLFNEDEHYNQLAEIDEIQQEFEAANEI